MQCAWTLHRLLVDITQTLFVLYCTAVQIARELGERQGASAWGVTGVQRYTGKAIGGAP